jgi:mitogen-activated protein kinase 15
MTEKIDSHILMEYEVVRLMGSGAYGHVWEVRERRTGRRKALKKIFDAFRHGTDSKRTYREVIVLRQLSHPNVVQLERVVRAEGNRDLYLVFEVMECDLHFVVVERRLHSKHRKWLAYQMLKALLYLQGMQLIHRDIKPANILLNENCDLKFCDFGLVRSLREGEASNLTEEVATRWYRAPEVLLGSRSYSYPVDVWSVGCVLGEMLAGKPLFMGESTLDQFQSILSFTGLPSDKDMVSLEVPRGLSLLEGLVVKKRPLSEWFGKADKDELDLISQLLQINPHKRLTPTQALSHPFLSEFAKNEVVQFKRSAIELPLKDNINVSVQIYRSYIYE